jgi:hypothetical protein
MFNKSYACSHTQACAAHTYVLRFFATKSIYVHCVHFVCMHMYVYIHMRGSVAVRGVSLNTQ